MSIFLASALQRIPEIKLFLIMAHTRFPFQTPVFSFPLDINVVVRIQLLCSNIKISRSTTDGLV